MKKFLLSTIAAAGMIAGSAQAASVTIVFQNPGADMPTGNFTTGGTCNGVNISGSDLCTSDASQGFEYSKGFATVTATAFDSNGLTNLMQDLRPTNSGLAVLSAGEGSSDDQVQFDSGESIVFDFGSDVIFDAIDFNAGGDVNCSNFGSEGPCGTFDLFVDGVLEGNFAAMDNMAFSLIGQTFEFVATQQGAGFAIGSISVSEVPVPGAAVAMISGLAGLGAARRRKKS